MGIIKQTGLKGLPSLNDLTEEQKIEWYTANPKSATRTFEQNNTIYKNQQFISRFGKEVFNSMPDLAERDKYFSDVLVKESFLERYGEDNIDFHTSEGSIYFPEARKYLLENNYKTSTERTAEREEALANVDKANAATPIWATGPESALANAGYRKGVEYAYDTKDKQNQNILDKAFEIDNNVIRQRKDISELKALYTNNLLSELDTNGAESIDTKLHSILDARDEQGNPYFPIYQAYKDEHQVSDLSIYDKIDMLSQYNAIMTAAANASSEEEANILSEKAFFILTDDIHHAIYENTTVGDNLLNTGNLVGTKFCSSLGQVCAGSYSLYLYLNDRDAYNKFILGKNKDGSNIEGWFNPQFLSGMDQYGVWTVADYNQVLNNGGISSNAILRDVGDEYEFWTTATLYDSMGQLGYAAASIGMDYLLTGGVGAAMKGTGKAAMKQLIKWGVNPRTVIKAKNLVNNPLVDYVTDMARVNLHSIGESTLEATGVAQEVYLETKKKQQDLLENPEFIARINSEVQQRLEEEFPNGSTKFVKSSGDTNELVNLRLLRENEIRQEIINKYLAESEKIAEEAAGAAFATQASVMQVKNSIGDAVMTSYLFAKPFSTKIRQHNTIDPKRTIVNADGTLSGKDFTWKDFAKTSTKVVLQGGAEEFTDNMTHTGAVELGLNYYNNYLQHLYNGEDIANANLMEGAALAWLNGAESSFFDEGAYFEAMLGAISPITNTVINPVTPLRFSSKDYRARFKEMGALEKVNEFMLYNPLVREALSEKQNYESNKQVIAAVNDVISNHGSDFKDIAAGINFVREFNEMRGNAEVVDAKDSKFNLAFQFLTNLNTLSQAGSTSPLYSKYLQMISDASEGNVSEEMITQYLAQPENKIILQNNSKEQAYQMAAEQIKKNAKQLISLTSEYQQTYKAISDFSNGTLDSESINQLVYQTMLSKNWNSRIQEMEKTISGSSSPSSNVQSGQLNKNGIESILQELKGKENAILATSKGKPKGRLKTLLNRNKKTSKVYQDMLSSGETGKILTAEEIINLNPAERNRMLSHHNLYTSEQVTEIEKAESILAQKDPDYRSKIKDIAILQSRVEQNNESFKNLLDNPARLIEYKNALILQALHDAVITRNRIAVSDMLNSLDAAYAAKDGSFVEKAKNLSSTSLQTVIDARPEYNDILTPLVKRATAMETLNSIVNGLDIQDAQKGALKNALATITENSTNEQEVIDSIEDFIDNSGMELTLREQLNEILNLAKDRNLIRNAVKVENRGNKLEKERKAKDKKDKRNKKAKERREKAKAKKEQNKAKETKKEPEIEFPVEEPTIEETKVEEPIINATNGEVISPEVSTKGVEIISTTENITVEEEELPASTVEASHLRGNVFSPYDVSDLHEGKISSTIPRGAWLKAFFEWMKNEGINYQEIIDFELAEIMKLNPTVHYLMTNPNNVSTNDKILVKTPLLVVEFTDEVKKIHKESRGGIIRADGKDWLVIGTLGYQTNTSEQPVWEELMKPLMGRRNEYFKNNPKERFTIDTKYTTALKNIALGNLIRQLEGEDVLNRSISELLSDPKRNPHELKWTDLSFGLQTDSGFGISRPLDRVVYSPNQSLDNSGNIFVMAPSSNGKYIPVTIKPAYLEDLRTSELKTLIYDLCMQLTSPNYEDRYEAIRQLCFLLHFTPENNILIGTDKINKLSIKENDVIVYEFDLSAENLDRQSIFNTLIKSRFRIQITPNNLQDLDKMKQLDKAGVLQTDIAVLGTMGSHFTVLVSDLKTGKPIEPATVNSSENVIVKGNSLSTTGEVSQLLNGRRVSKHNNVWRDEFDNPITDANTLRQIEYLNMIEQHDITMAYKDAAGNNVYIISSAEDNPIVVKVNLSHRVQILEGNDAKTVISYVNSKNREKSVKETKLQDINAWLDESDSNSITPSQPQSSVQINKKEIKTEEKTNKGEKFSELKRENSLEDLHNSNNLLNFVQVITDPTVGDKVLDALEEIFESKGWGELPDQYTDIDSFLRSKDIPLPKSLEQIDSWLDLIKDCR